MRQVAAPQAAAHLEPIEAGFGAKANRFQFTRHRFAEAIARHLIHAAGFFAAAKVVQRGRTGPAAGAGVLPAGQLQRGHVAVAHPARALLHAAAKRFHSMRSSSRVRP
jgi:hypothetical protein